MIGQHNSCRIEQPSRPAIPSKRRALALQFGSEVSEVVRRRITYALQTFCAVYAYEFATESNEDALRLSYGGEHSELPLCAGYNARPLTEPAPEPSTGFVQGMRFPRFHPTTRGDTDWLGEIFEWISAADEQAIIERDSVGRIPYSATLHGRYGLDPCVPYASVAMESLHALIAKHTGEPVTRGKCDIVATHDVDFLPISARTAFKRFLKNMAIAGVAYRDPMLLASILFSGLRRLGKKHHVLDCLLPMLERERELGIASTCNVLCRQAHRRDGNYAIEDSSTAGYLRDMQSRGVEIGLHGSYTSLDAPGLLADEYLRLSQLGIDASGGRQHWLRYRDHSLFEELSRAGADYDCSVGYSERIGFRSGACFSYAPYNFREESAYPLLEIPLVVMDSALYCESHDPRDWSAQCNRVLEMVRKFGRGGVSILWHDTVFHGGQLPQGIADLYWALKQDDENWINAGQFVQAVWHHFVRAGLLAEGRHGKSSQVAA